MASEIIETLSFSHQNPNTGSIQASKITLSNSAGQSITQTGTRLACGIQTLTTSPGALDIAVLGGGTLGRFFFKNLDATNNAVILTGTGGVLAITLLPGECAMGRFGSGVTAPFVESSASTVKLQYAIAEA